MRNFTKSAVCVSAQTATTVRGAAAQGKLEVNAELLIHANVSAEQVGFGQSSMMESGARLTFLDRI